MIASVQLLYKLWLFCLFSFEDILNIYLLYERLTVEGLTISFCTIHFCWLTTTERLFSRLKKLHVCVYYPVDLKVIFPLMNSIYRLWVNTWHLCSFIKANPPSVYVKLRPLSMSVLIAALFNQMLSVNRRMNVVLGSNKDTHFAFELSSYGVMWYIDFTFPWTLSRLSNKIYILICI